MPNEIISVSINSSYNHCYTETPITVCDRKDTDGNPVSCPVSAYTDLADLAIYASYPSPILDHSKRNIEYYSSAYYNGLFVWGWFNWGPSYPLVTPPPDDDYMTWIKAYFVEAQNKSSIDTFIPEKRTNYTYYKPFPNWDYFSVNSDDRGCTTSESVNIEFISRPEWYSTTQMATIYLPNYPPFAKSPDYYISADSSPGQYPFYVSADFKTKLGGAAYLAQYNLNVCNPTVNPPKAACQVSNPTPRLGENVTFTINTQNLDLSQPTSYNWEGTMSASNTYTKSFNGYGKHTVNLVIRNGSKTFRADPSCSVEIIDPTLVDFVCTANPT